jgi:hypothetical protein
VFVSAGAELELTGTRISGNYASEGGGVWLGASATVRDGIIEDNVALSAGGGLLSDGGSSVDRTELRGNTSHEAGGGVAIGRGDLVLDDVTIVDNAVLLQATYPGPLGGGGIAVLGSAVAQVTGTSEVTANAADVGGGAWLEGSLGQLFSEAADWGENTPTDVAIDTTTFGPYGSAATFACAGGTCDPPAR